MILGLRTKVFKDGLLPVTLHMVPILNLTMTNGVVYSIARCLRVRESFVTYEEVKVLYAAL